MSAGRLPALRCLQLHGCELGAVGASSLAPSLVAPSCVLAHLDLSANAIGDEGALALAAQIPYVSHLDEGDSQHPSATWMTPG